VKQRNNIKYDKSDAYNTDVENNKSVNADNFNKYFLTVAETICKGPLHPSEKSCNNGDCKGMII